MSKHSVLRPGSFVFDKITRKLGKFVRRVKGGRIVVVVDGETVLRYRCDLIDRTTSVMRSAAKMTVDKLKGTEDLTRAREPRLDDDSSGVGRRGSHTGDWASYGCGVCALGDVRHNGLYIEWI